MVVFEMVVENIDKYEEALARFPDVAAGNLDNQIKYAAQKMRTALQLYPPPPSGSTYDRTYELRDGWLEPGGFEFSHVSGFDFDFKIENKVPYAGFVQGSKEDQPHQTETHRRTGWKTTDEVGAQFEGELGKEAEKILQAAYREVFERA